MKKIFISLAAIAALVSCVEEKGLEPQQPVSGNQLTIKATTAPATKTVLGDELPADGISVLWEEDDAIAVVLKDGNSGTASKEFTASQVAGTNADFTGEFTADDLEYFDTENVTDAYAIYPSASVSDAVISHTLSEVQNGNITSGMNLAYAALDADEVLGGTAASATFNNALVLIQITVPEGVQYVSLSTGNSGDELAGTATYTYRDGVLTRSAISGYKRTVTLKNDDDSALEAGTYSLLVFPSTRTNTLTLKMEGTDEAVYEKSLNDIKLMASQCYTINLERLSYVGEVLPASPVGGEFVIPFVTTEDYTYTVKVEIAEGDDEDWIVYEETRGFHKDEIVLALETNDSGKDRSANVTVTIENVGSKTFVVSQASVFMGIIEDENGNPIKWQETFDVYPSEEDAAAGTNKIAEYSNLFTISLTTGNECQLGTYKIENIFKTDKYNSAQGQVAGKGGVYYANYSNNQLILSVDNAEKSYFFKSDVVLAYDSNSKKFTSGNLLFSGNSLSDVWKKEGVIANYSATEYEEQVSADITGTYSASGKYGSGPSYTSTAFSDTFTITANGDAKGQYKITGLFNIYGGGGGTYYANFADNVLTILAANSTHDNYVGGGSLPNDVTMNYSSGTFTIEESILISQTNSAIYVGKDYTATKQ